MDEPADIPPSPPLSAERELLTVNEAMARVKVSRRTIYNWLGKGWLVTERTVGGRVRIDATSLWRVKP